MLNWLKQNAIDNLVIIGFLLAVTTFFVVSSDYEDVQAANYTRLDSGWTAGTLIPKYYASFKLPIISGTAFNDVGSWLPDIAKVANVRVNQSGKWSEVLAGANLTENDVLLIPEGVKVVYDEVNSQKFKAVAVKGSLTFDPTRDTKMTVETLHVYVTGELNISPDNKNIRSEVVFSGTINTTEDPEQFNLGLVASGGKIQIIGTELSSSFTNVLEAEADSNTILVNNSDGWKVGDELYLAGSEENVNINDLAYKHKDQTETLSIVNIFDDVLNPTEKIITLNKKLKFNHNSYVTNVTRNVILSSDIGGNNDKGHILLSGHTLATISNASLLNLGRTTVDEIDDTVFSGNTVSSVGGNQNNRHALQARYVQNSFFFKGNSIINSGRFGILNYKGTGVISGNTIVGSTGSGIASGSGLETGLVVNNIVVGTTEGITESETESRFSNSQGEDIGVEGSGFWFRGPLLKVEGNVATGYFPGGAYVYQTDSSFVDDNQVPNIDGVDKTLKGKNINIDTTPIQAYGSFDNNKAQGLIGSGLYLKNRKTLSGDIVDNLSVKNLAADAIGLKVKNSTQINIQNTLLTGVDINSTSVGVLVAGDDQTKVNIKNSKIENFAYGYETPALGGELEAVTFDNKIDINVKTKPGIMSLVLTGPKFTNTSRDNIKFNEALGASETVYAYNYNQTGKDYRIYSSLETAPSTALALVGLKNGVADNLSGGVDPESGGNALVTNVSSDGLTVSWEAVVGATGYKIFIASEPSNLSIPSKRKELTTVSAGVLTYRIQKLSANTDIFIRVEGISGNKFYHAYAKTKGGQSAQLAGPLKSVHLYAPDILMLVMEDKRVQSYSARDNWLDKGVDRVVGYTGSTWQNGPWSIKRNDGSTITVTDVYRESVPVGNFYDAISSIGKVTQNMDNLLDVENHIFIKLNQNIGTDEILDVSGPSNYNVIIPFSDKYLETPVIQLNQVGYNPRSNKRYAYVSGWMGDGGGLSLNNFPANANVLLDNINALTPKTEVVSNISVAIRSNNDIEAGSPVKEINLAQVPANDSAYYRVQLPGIGVSYKTMVSELATLKAFYITTRGLFLNRWGRDLDCQYTDWCDRPQDHPVVYEAEKTCNGLPCENVFPRPGETVPAGNNPQSTPPTDKPRSLVGGHHDAGDFDIRKFHYQVGRDLLRAFELNQIAFKDNQLNIPESGNGIPDLLDEILWSLAAWEQLQEANGGVRSGVESYGHPPLSYADVDTFPYWTFSIDPQHTLRVAGLFAQASRLLAPFNNIKALELRQRAIRAYDYAIDQGINHTLGGPIVYASSELYRLTGEAKYKTMFESAWMYASGQSSIPSFRNGAYWYEAWTLTRSQPLIFDYVQGYLGSTGANSAYKQAAITSFNNQTKATIAGVENGSAHRSGRPVGSATTWGAATAVNRYTQDVDASMQLGGISSADRQADFDVFSLMGDYVLGGNPMGISWVTGLGSKSPTNILWGDSVAFMTLENMPTMPGIPVYGIGDLGGAPYYDYGKNVTYPDFDSRPKLRKYADTRTFIQNNEFTINETQSTVVKLFAILLGSDLNVPNSWKPGGSDHKNPLPLSQGYSYSGGKGSSGPVDPTPTATSTVTTYDGAFGMLQNFQSSQVGMFDGGYPGYLWYFSWGTPPTNLNVARASSTLDIIASPTPGIGQGNTNQYLRLSVDDSIFTANPHFDAPGSLANLNSTQSAFRLPIGLGDILSPRADILRVKFKIERGNIGLTFGSPVSQLGNSDVLLKVKYLSPTNNDDCTPLTDTGGWIQCDFDLNKDLIRNSRRANYSGGNSGASGNIKNLEGKEIIHYTRWVQEPISMHIVTYDSNDNKIISGNPVVLVDDIEVINSAKGKAFPIFTNPTLVNLIDNFENDISQAFTVNFNWPTTQQKVPVLTSSNKANTGTKSLLITSKTGEELAWTGMPADNADGANAVSFEMRVEASNNNFANHVIDFIALTTPDGGPFSWAGLSGSNGYTYQLSEASTASKNFAVYHGRRMVPQNQWVTVTIPFADFVAAYGSGSMVAHHQGQKPLQASEISVIGLQTSWRQVSATSSIYIDSIRYVNVPGTNEELRSFWQPYVNGSYIATVDIGKVFASLDVRSQVGNVIQSFLGNIKEIILDFFSKILNIFKGGGSSDVVFLTR